MQADELVATYLRALATSDVALMLTLFTDDGQVASPLYGVLPAAQFYPALFADTGESHLTLRSVMQGTDRAGHATVSFWFHFDWRLASGVAATFEVVDVAQLDRDGRITALHIIYDTVDARPRFEAETGSSWRGRVASPVVTRLKPR
ncbi:MAG: nuclear transport factor 2 family protein [Pseudonocardiales bacterium]|nr:MAG: nuclear transport factor 2 family protein [Pseudonocardiales bacterium]